jgi:formylglycine-generating enzyme required for sulfatase activity
MSTSSAKRRKRRRGSDNSDDQMVWVPGGTFTMGSDRHHPEEAPAHRVVVQGFWMDRYPVTNEQFDRFVAETGHVTLAERPPDPADYPDARPALLVPASAVFRQPRAPVDMSDAYSWWTSVPGASWRHPAARRARCAVSNGTRSSTSPGRTSRPLPPGPARHCPPKRSGNEHAAVAVPTAPSSREATS